MKKKTWIILVALIAFALLCLLIYFKYNKNDTLLKNEKTIHNVTFSDVKINKKGSVYIFKVSIKSKEDITFKNIEADIKNEEGTTIDVISFGKVKLEKGKTKKVKLETTKNLNSAYEVSYAVYK